MVLTKQENNRVNVDSMLHLNLIEKIKNWVVRWLEQAVMELL